LPIIFDWFKIKNTQFDVDTEKRSSKRDLNTFVILLIRTAGRQKRSTKEKRTAPHCIPQYKITTALIENKD
jgi:hypothetical protein